MNAEQQQIQAAVQQGDYAKAESLIEHVLVQHPNSAKAHYIHAEVLAHMGKLTQAQQEVSTAKRLDPQITFTSPEKFGKFETYLDVAAHAHKQTATQSQTLVPTTPQPTPEQPIGVMPIVLGVLVLVLIAVVISRLFSRRQAVVQAGPTYPPAGQGYQGAPQYPNAGGTTTINNGMGGGSGAGSTVAAGLGGLAAGMMLERALDQRHEEGYRDAEGRETYAAPADESVGNGEADYAQRQLDDQPFDMGNDDNSWDDNSGDIDNTPSGGDGW
jgi:tetratricopeptide (TPR) repeat protein